MEEYQGEELGRWDGIVVYLFDLRWGREVKLLYLSAFIMFVGIEICGWDRLTSYETITKKSNDILKAGREQSALKLTSIDFCSSDDLRS